MNTEMNEVAAQERFCGWVYCDPKAIRDRNTVIQVCSDTLIGITGSGRIIVAKGTCGPVGHEWQNGQFDGDGNGEVAFAYFGERGSVEFAAEIGASRSLPPGMQYLRNGPQWPGYTDTESHAVVTYPGLMKAIATRIAAGNFNGAKAMLEILQVICDFARTRLTVCPARPKMLDIIAAGGITFEVHLIDDYDAGRTMSMQAGTFLGRTDCGEVGDDGQYIGTDEEIVVHVRREFNLPAGIPGRVR